MARYTQNLTAAVVGTRKVIVRREGIEQYELGADPLEAAPVGGTIADFESACRRDGLPPAAVAATQLRGSSAASERVPTRPQSREPGGPLHLESPCPFALIDAPLTRELHKLPTQRSLSHWDTKCPAQ